MPRGAGRDGAVTGCGRVRSLSITRVMLFSQCQALRPSTAAALARRGLLRTEQLATVDAATGQCALAIGPLALADKCGITTAEAALVLEVVGDYADAVQGATQCTAAATQSATAAFTPVALPASARSVLDLLQAEAAADDAAARIPTFSHALDELLGRGLQLGTVTELCGLPGVGKTQLCMQLAAAAPLHSHFGGAGGDTIYVDTEGSFSASRFREIASAAVVHVQRIVSDQRAMDALQYAEDAVHADTLRGIANDFTTDRVMGSVSMLRVHDTAGLVSAATLLDSLLTRRTSVRLVVVDSIAYPMRVHAPSNADTSTWTQAAERNRLLLSLARSLHAAAAKHGVAVVVTNHMIARSGDFSGSITAVPALGDTWAHAIGTRIALSAPAHADALARGERRAEVLKSTNTARGAATFCLTQDGIRDAS